MAGIRLDDWGLVFLFFIFFAPLTGCIFFSFLLLLVFGDLCQDGFVVDGAGDGGGFVFVVEFGGDYEG